jgi:twinkle protein
MAVGLQRDLVILDHISMVVSGQDTDERKALDMLMTEMRKLVENTGIRLFIICHLGRKQGKNFNEGSQISLSDLRGSAGVEQLSDIVIADERNQQGDDPDVHQLRVLKNRPIGKLGDAGNAKYHVDIGRLLPYTPLESESDTTGLNNDQKKIAKELQEGIKF